MPRKKRRKSLAWLRLLVPLAEEKQLVVWWTDRPFLGADRFISIGQKLGAVAFDSYHDPMLDRVKMEQEGEDLREMVCEMTGEACSQFYPFYSEGNGDYYGWLDSAFGQVVLLDHEEAAFRPTHASFDAWFYWRLT